MIKRAALFTSLLPLFVLFSFSQMAAAEKKDVFKGEAFEGGKLVYIENHVVTLDDSGKPLEATTTYVSPEGKNLGVLHSDFTSSLSLPNHTFEDERTKGKYGIRRSDGKIVMFNQDAGKAEEIKTLDSASDGDRLQVGCQGFNYYLFGKIDEIKKQKTVPVLFMIPGDLTTYRFKLQYERENPDKTVEFVVKIESWFLRIFAPKLEFRYDPKINRITWYRGVSNIKNENGKLMDIEIKYTYI